MKDLGVNCSTVLKWNIRKCDGGLWTGFIWPRMGTGEGLF
jgi:hypothetical protein